MRLRRPKRRPWIKWKPNPSRGQANRNGSSNLREARKDATKGDGRAWCPHRAGGACEWWRREDTLALPRSSPRIEEWIVGDSWVLYFSAGCLRLGESWLKAMNRCNRKFSARAYLRRVAGFWLCAGFALVALAGLLSSSRGEAATSSPDKLSQRVIYFGELETARGKDFLNFLRSHFENVGSGQLSAFREETTAPYDVVILDYGELKVSNNRIEMPPNPVRRGFKRPTITVGATGALISERLGLKTGYL